MGWGGGCPGWGHAYLPLLCCERVAGLPCGHTIHASAVVHRPTRSLLGGRIARYWHMTDNTRHSAEEVIFAIEQGQTKLGTARVLGCTRQTIDNYCRRWKTVDDAFRAKRRELVDLAEKGLRAALDNEQPWAITFTLKTLGKDDGYTERQEVTGADGAPLVVVERIIANRSTADNG